MTLTHNQWIDENGKLVVVPLTPEQIAQREADEAAWLAGKNNRDIINQITALEATQTPRRVREGGPNETGGTAAGRVWLDNLNEQITALRAQLT